MEGITFYFISWCFWIISTFFLKKTSAIRLKLSLWLMLMIILAPHTVAIYSFEISLAAIFMVFSLVIMASKFKGVKIISLLISSLIIMLAYTCFHLFAMFDPVWVIFPKDWMLAILLVSLAFLLQDKGWERIFIIFMGALQGEFLFAWVIGKYPFPYTIGSYAFLDTIFLSAIILSVWRVIELLSIFLSRYINPIEKGKQKIS